MSLNMALSVSDRPTSRVAWVCRQHACRSLSTAPHGFFVCSEMMLGLAFCWRWCEHNPQLLNFHPLTAFAWHVTIAFDWNNQDKSGSSCNNSRATAMPPKMRVCDPHVTATCPCLSIETLQGRSSVACRTPHAFDARLDNARRRSESTKKNMLLPAADGGM